jgi:hypothetical protein
MLDWESRIKLNQNLYVNFYYNKCVVVPRFKIPLHGYQVGLGLFTKNGIQ